MLRKVFYILILSSILTSCISTKLTIKNIDDTAIRPKLIDHQTYRLVEKATDKKYGYHPDYPVNLGFGLLDQREANQKKFLNALQGPSGEAITYSHHGNCCPFPTNTSPLGSGMLDVYLISWDTNQKPLTLYLNTYEKGEILIPVGLTAKTK